MKRCERKTDGKKHRYTAEEAHIKNLKVFKANICEELKVTNLDAENYILDGTSLNEKLLGSDPIGIVAQFDPILCEPSTFPYGCYTPQQKPGNPINPLVWQKLLDSGNEIAYGPDGIQDRLNKGRERLGLPKGPGLQLVGSITLNTSVKSFPNDPTKSNLRSFLTSLGWTLELANTTQYENGVFPNPLVTSFLTQVAWLDKNGVPQSKLIEAGNQQINPTLDYFFDPDFRDVASWGEKFTGLSSVSINQILLMGDTGAIQLLLFREVGLTVYFPDEADTCGDCAYEPRAGVNTGVINTGNNANISLTQGASVGVDVSAIPV